MAKDKSEIISEIEQYVMKFGGKFTEWYVGTAIDPKHALYNKHKLKQGEPGMLRTAHTEVQASDIVRHFVTVRKTKGDPDSVIEPGRLYVYAYKTQPHTKP